MLPPCVRGAVPPPPLRDENALPVCGVRGSFGRLENASVPPAVRGGAPAPAASGAAKVFGFTFASIFEDGAAAASSSILKVSAAPRRAPGITNPMSGASPAAPALMSQPPRALPACEPFNSPPAAPPAVGGRERLAEEKTLAGALARLSAHHFVEIEVRLHAVLLLVVELVVRHRDVRVRTIACSCLTRPVLSRSFVLL